MSRVTLVLAILSLSVVLLACDKGREAPTEEPGISKQESRRLLDELDITYDKKTFLECIEHGDAFGAELFLAAGMNPNVRSRGKTALFVAASRDYGTILRILLKYGAEADGSAGRKALYEAAHNGNIEVARSLLQAGAKTRSLFGASLHGDLLEKLVITGNTELVRLLLENGAAPSEKAVVAAAKCNRTKELRLMLNRGANPDAKDEYQTALLWGHDSPQIVRVLLDAGANIQERDQYGSTALLLSAFVLDVESAQVLLDFGADPNAKNNEDETALIRAAKGFRIRSEDADAAELDAKREYLNNLVKILLSAGADPGVKDKSGKTAAAYAPDDVVKLLEEPINNGKKAFRRKMPRGEIDENQALGRLKPPEEEAAMKSPRFREIGYDFDKAFAARKELLQKNIPFNVKTFNISVVQDDIDTVKIFLSAGIDANVKNPDTGLPVLTYAAKEGHTEIVRLLLEKGANPNMPTDFIDDTPLYAAASYKGSTEMVRLLLEYGANVNVRGTWGGTPLTAASNAEKVRLILEKDPDVNARSNGGKWGYCYSSLELASQAGQADIVRMLLEKEPDIDIESYEASLFTAARDGHLEVVQALLDHGPKVTVRQASTALSLAAKAGHHQIVRLLVARGPDPNERDYQACTDFMRAVHAGQIESLHMFLERGTEINAHDNGGQTALIYAVLNGRADIVEFLIDNGADVNATDKAGGTALSYAKLQNRANIVDQLKKANATAGAGLTRKDTTARLLSHVVRVESKPVYADWDGDGQKDGAVIEVVFWGSLNEAIDFEGLELPVLVEIYADTVSPEAVTLGPGPKLTYRGKIIRGIDLYRERPVYKETNMLKGSKDKIKIPYEEIGPLQAGENYGAIDSTITLPDGRFLEEKKDWEYWTNLRYWSSEP